MKRSLADRARRSLVSAVAVAYIVPKIDIGKTLAHPRLGEARVALLSAALTLVTVPPMAWRWQRLLAARGVRERLPG